MQYITPLWPAFPEIFLLAMACVILIVDLFVREEKRGISYGLTLFTLFGCAVLTGVGAVVNTAKVQPGQTAAVIGLGGVGMCSLLGAVASGAREIVAA